MSKHIEAYVNNWQPSRACFVYVKEEGSIRGTLAHSYRPTPQTTDPVEKIACENYQESLNFSTMKYEVNSTAVVSDTLHRIVRDVVRFYGHYSGHKKPQRTAIARWLTSYRVRSSEELDDSLILVYRHIRSFCNAQMLTDVNFLDNKAKVSNVLALLEIMRNKYEK
jgi:hypothetical protein